MNNTGKFELSTNPSIYNDEILSFFTQLHFQPIIATLFLAAAPFQGVFAYRYERAEFKTVSFSFAYRCCSDEKYVISCSCFDLVGGT